MYFIVFFDFRYSVIYILQTLSSTPNKTETINNYTELHTNLIEDTQAL